MFGLCLVGVALLVLLGCCLFCFLLLFVSAWWNRGIAEEVTMASNGKAVTGAAVMARSANEEKKKSRLLNSIPNLTCRPWGESLRCRLLVSGFLMLDVQREW